MTTGPWGSPRCLGCRKLPFRFQSSWFPMNSSKLIIVTVDEALDEPRDERNSYQEDSTSKAVTERARKRVDVNATPRRVASTHLQVKSSHTIAKHKWTIATPGIERRRIVDPRRSMTPENRLYNSGYQELTDRLRDRENQLRSQRSGCRWDAVRHLWYESGHLQTGEPDREPWRKNQKRGRATSNHLEAIDDWLSVTATCRNRTRRNEVGYHLRLRIMNTDAHQQNNPPRLSW